MGAEPVFIRNGIEIIILMEEILVAVNIFSINDLEIIMNNNVDYAKARKMFQAK